METQEIIVRDEKGQLIKLNAVICPSCGSKVWPSLTQHMREVCPDTPRDIEIWCRRCKLLVKTIPWTREEVSKQASGLHVFLCGRCRSRATRTRRRRIPARHTL